jgi:hypothetical protein
VLRPQRQGRGRGPRRCHRPPMRFRQVRRALRGKPMRHVPSGCPAGTTYPPVDESLDRLHWAGWSVGDYGTATRWVVSGCNGENLIYSEGTPGPRRGTGRASRRRPWGCWRRRGRRGGGDRWAGRTAAAGRTGRRGGASASCGRRGSPWRPSAADSACPGSTSTTTSRRRPRLPHWPSPARPHRRGGLRPGPGVRLAGGLRRPAPPARPGRREKGLQPPLPGVQSPVRSPSRSP